VLRYRDVLERHPRLAIVGPDDAAAANFGPVVKSVQPGGYVSLFSAGYMQLVTGTVNPGVLVGVASVDDPALQVLGYPVALDVTQSRVVVFDPPPPRARVARCVRPGDAVEVRQPEFPRGACVTHPSGSAASVAVPSGPASIVAEGPGWQTIRAEGPGWLVTTLPWYPGWTATVDGAARPVEVVNGALVGVYLTAGERLVELRYRPAGFDVGLGVSGVAVLVLVLAWWADRERRQGGGRSAAAPDPASPDAASVAVEPRAVPSAMPGERPSDGAP
jgi:hypothetical protein